MNVAAKFGSIAVCLLFAGATLTFAQDHSAGESRHEHLPRLAEIVALDECDPVTFNAALGPDFCKNVTLGAFTTLSDLFAKAVSGTPDPGWDFEPDAVKSRKETYSA